MRLSTSQFYQNNLNHITNKSGQASQQLDKLSSGVRVQTAADDPVAANSILNYKQELNKIARYQNNINLGENRLRREESILTSAENISQQAKELLLKGNNGSYSKQDKAALASELNSRIDELLDLANSRDEFGDYIFAGFQTDTEPFVRDSEGNVSYRGDSGQRELAISDNVKVGLNHDGQLVFGQVPILNANEADGTDADERGVFDILNRAKEWLSGEGNTPSEQSEYADILDELDAVGGHFTRIRADTGIRLQRLDNQRETHADMTLTVDKVRGGMEDLDFAQAIGELNQTMVALQATQSVFGKLQGMSLFNYI